MLVLKDRELHRDGTSVLCECAAAEEILDNGELKPHHKIPMDESSETYRLMFNEPITPHPMSDEEPVLNTPHTPEQMKEVVAIIESSPRYREEYSDRVRREMSFFHRSNNIKFLLAIHEMIQSFKRDGVVWGVGRGSSVASLVLFLLEVHDINPLQYEIPFSELSKEEEKRSIINHSK